MSSEQLFNNAKDALDKVVSSTFNAETLLTFIVALAAAYVLSQLLAFGIIKLARYIGDIGDTTASAENRLRLRRLETYLSILLAFLRFAIFFIALITAWNYTHPDAAPAAIVASSTIFVVLAGATIVPLLRDLTTGGIMIAEQWYNVGDYINVLPFADVSGVVERMNLRSTKVRSLSGEVIWIHNQQIQGVRVSPNGVRTLELTMFVRNHTKGKALVEEVASTLPVEPTMLVTPLQVIDTHKLGERLWQLTATCQVAPGREWLIENFAREAIEESDKKDGKVIVHGPIVYNADPTAERRFKRAIRIKAPSPPPGTKPNPAKPEAKTSTKK